MDVGWLIPEIARTDVAAGRCPKRRHRWRRAATMDLCACLERWGGRPLLLLCLYQHILTEWLSPMWSVSNRFSQGDSTSPASGSGSAYGIENIFKRTRIQYGFVGLWCLTFINLNWVCVWVLCWMDRSCTRPRCSRWGEAYSRYGVFWICAHTYSEARFC